MDLAGYTNAFSSIPVTKQEAADMSNMDITMGRAWLTDYCDNIFQFDMFTGVIFHGQRQIGKSWFLRNYCKDRQTIYFSATRDMISNYDGLRTEIVAFLEDHPGIDVYRSLLSSTSLYDLLQLVFTISKEVNALYFVIDEFNYLVESEGFDIYVFKNIIDANKDTCSLRFILCGSNSGILASLADINKPLYGRFSQVVEIPRISYKAAISRLKNMPDWTQRLECSMICSGMPQLILIASQFASLADFMNYLLMTSPPVVKSIVEHLFLGERIDQEAATALIASLNGTRKQKADLKSEFCVSRDAGLFEAVFQKLIDTRLLEELPNLFSNHLKNRKLYKLSNLMVLIYAMYQKKGYTLLQAFQSKAEILHELFGHEFETLCAEFIRDYFHIFSPALGYWEDIVGTEKTRREEDILLVDNPNNLVYICECKFRSKAMSQQEVAQLFMNTRAVLAGKLRKQAVAVSLGGYTQDAKQFAEEHNIKLLSLSDIQEWVNK